MGGNEWVPAWLTAVGSALEVAEWKAICQAYHGLDRDAPMTAFIRKMRAKYPHMAKGFEEQLAEEVQKLKDDPELARREGLSEEDIQD